MRYIIVEDNYNLDDFVIREDNKTMYMRGALRILAQPHEEADQISIISYDDYKNDPKVEPWIANFLNEVGIKDFSPEEFDKAWSMAYPLTGNG